MYGTQNYDEFNYNDPTILVVLSSDSIVLAESTALVLEALDSLGLSETNNLTILVVDTLDGADATATILAAVDSLWLTELYDIVIGGAVSIVATDSYIVTDAGILQTEIVFCSISKIASMSLSYYGEASIQILQTKQVIVGIDKQFTCRVRIG